MIKKLLLAFIVWTPTFSAAQTLEQLEVNKEYPNRKLVKTRNLAYYLSLEKGETYEVAVLQKGIDVTLILTEPDDKKILEEDNPNRSNGYEKFEYCPTETKKYILKINRLDEMKNAQEGMVSILVRKFSKTENQRRKKIKKELEPENRKEVLTKDIDHFWEAFDYLKKCKTHNDSVSAFQTLYLDRATDGLLDFIKIGELTAERFVRAVAKRPKFYESIRNNTLEVKKAVPLIEEIVAKFRAFYPNFKSHKVCFAIGITNIGGTVSDKFLLIGAEVSTSTKNTNLSEFNEAFSKQLSSGEDVTQKIRNIVAHEYVHTQQKKTYDSSAITCILLYAIMREGFCDFIGELISGSQINLVAQEYGDRHEKEIWQEVKNELCSDSVDNWLYNYSSIKEKPADLGYYVGYKIAQEYYKNATDKRQAIIDIIEMSDPVRFLQISKYDQKIKR